MTREELVAAFALADVETLGRWYCDLNCFRKPADFPFELGEVDHVHREAPAFRMSWECVSEALGEAGCSRAWWAYELKRTEAEWRAWWNDGARNGPSPNLLDSGVGA